jgi:UDP-GlcNAc:undecaprenyl-phosphate GlcNAc-1-phosphate transferase
MGGTGVFVTVCIGVIGLLLFSTHLTTGLIKSPTYLAILLGGLVLQVGGILDDRWRLSAKQTVWFPVGAALLAVLGGLEVTKLTNPLGGFFAIPGLISSVGIFVWLLFMMYTTKLLDGVDGLATSTGAVAVLVIALLSLTTAFFQTDVSFFSAVVLGAFVGFLMWNKPPAKIYLGEGGSTLVGYLVGVLAVLAGSKAAIAVLVLGIPWLDMCFVMVRRYVQGGWKQIAIGDRTHLHHRLMTLGWSPRRVVLAHVFASLCLGLSALFLQSEEKLLLLILLVAATTLFMTVIALRESDL